MDVPEPEQPLKVSNGRIAGVVALLTVLLTAVIVTLGPGIADSISGSTSAGSSEGAGAVATVMVPGVGKPIAVPVEKEVFAAQGFAVEAPSGPALPEPGAEQPADPEAARSEIRSALETLWGGDNPREVRLSVLDDATNLDATMDEVRKRYEEASTTTVPEVGDIVFTDGSNAAFLFRLRYVGAPLLPSRIGTARLVEGRWLITRATLCDVLSQGGSTCPPGAG